MAIEEIRAVLPATVDRDAVRALRLAGFNVQEAIIRLLDNQ